MSSCRAVNHGRELLGDLLSSVESDMGYAERAVAHIAGGLLQLSAVETSAEEKADAKQRLSKALKLAHGRLQNHQLVSQVLLFMTPLQVRLYTMVVTHRAAAVAVPALTLCTNLHPFLCCLQCRIPVILQA